MDQSGRRNIHLFAVILYLLSFNSAFAADDLAAVKQKFIGHWELASYFTYPPQGGEVDMNYIGVLIYDELGNMNGQGMPVDLPERVAQSNERVSGGFAYWGTFDVDLDKEIVIHHVAGSAIRPQWVGGDNIRHYEFAGDTLALSLKNGEGRTTAILTWRKVK